MLSPKERQEKRNSIITSMILHSIVVMLLFLPFLKIPIPPPGQEGILVNLGLPDVGQGDNNTPGPLEPTPQPAEPQKAEEQPVREEPQKRPESTPKPQPQKQVVTTEDPEAVALKQRQEKERQERAEADRRQREEEAARQRQAEEEARKKAEADKLKNQIGGLFGGGGSGSGKGNTGKPGNQGDPEGDPNATKLEGISTGSGTVGGGLGSRGVLAAPKIEDRSQNEGTVVLDVCVDRDGNVISATYTQRGSSTTNATLRQLAESNARRWKFAKGDVDKQCGTITYRFKVQ